MISANAHSDAAILIVDDEDLNRKLLNALLLSEGYRTICAASGEEALAMVAQKAPDLILLDIMMPGMDGYEVTRILKANPATSQIPIIVLSALEDRSARLLGLAAGAEEFLCKPIDNSELCLRVRNLLRLKDYNNFYQNHARILEEQVQARTVDLQRFRKALDATGDGIFLTNRSTMRFVEVNATACTMLGYTREELFELGPTSLFAMTRDALERTYDAMIAGDGANRMIETLMRCKDGRMLQIEVHRQAQRFGEDWIIVSVLRDVTERKLITEALHASNLQLRHITDAIPTLLCYLDRQQRFCFHNKACEEVFGLRFDQIHGRPLGEVLGPLTYAAVREKAEEVLRGHVVHYEQRAQVTPQGGTRDYAMHFFPRYGEGADAGKVIGFYAQGTDITEFKRIDRMKTEFISTVSHELRTPLTSIRGSLGLVAGGVAGELPEAARNLVGIAKNNCERLIRLINDILDSEKIEAGKMHLNLQVVDIRQLVQQTLVANQGFADQHRVKLRLQAPDAALQVCIDSDRLIQVLTNLISNAVKFSPPGSTVDMHVLRVARQVRVEIVDRGPGIQEEFRARIFQKFSQADSSDTRQKGGSGLGLNISKGLVEKMGGQIGFVSEAAVSTTFFLELPEWQNPAPPLQPVLTQAVLSRPRMLIWEGDTDVASLENCKPRILHVEDDPDVQDIVAAIAEDFADFEFATTLNEARALLREHRFDLVLLDLGLGQDSGGDLFKDIDALDLPPPVIVFSASDVAPAEGQQAQAVLVKARNSNTDLLKTIQRVLQIPGNPGPTRPQPLT